MMNDLGEWVLRRACRQSVDWRKAGLPRLPISINLDDRQLRLPSFPKLVDDILREHGASPQLLSFEILEQAFIEDADATVANMHAIKEIGASFAFDDFGTGYSALAYLMRVPIDTLKIDISFIRHLITSPQAAALVHSIVDIGRDAGLNVVAEGVEDLSQYLVLRAYRCDTVQGYIFSPAQRPDDYARLLASGASFLAPKISDELLRAER